MLPGVPGVSAGAPAAEGCGAMGAIVAAVYGAAVAGPGGENCACESGAIGVAWPFVYPCVGLEVLGTVGGVDMAVAAIAVGVVTVVGVGRGTPPNCGEAAALEGVWPGDTPTAPGLCA